MKYGAKTDKNTEAISESARTDAKRQSDISIRIRYAVILIAAGAFFGAACGLALGLSRDLPQIRNLENFKPILSTILYSSDGQVLAEFGIEKRRRTSFARMPLQLKQAMLSVEDQYFYWHF